MPRKEKMVRERAPFQWYDTLVRAYTYRQRGSLSMDVHHHFYCRHHYPVPWCVSQRGAILWSASGSYREVVPAAVARGNGMIEGPRHESAFAKAFEHRVGAGDPA
jgi:hypothetical protein